MNVSTTRHNIQGWMLVSLTLLGVTSTGLNDGVFSNTLPFMFVGAAEHVINNNIDSKSASIDKANADENSKGDANNKVDEEHVPIPASLLKATRVGAKIREGRSQKLHQEKEQENDAENEIHDASTANEDEDEIIQSPNTNSNMEEVPRNAKPPLTGCHWGATGCKKGKLSTGSNSAAGTGELNASSIEMDAEDRDDNDIKSPTSSSLAGSATAKIEAHVMKGRAPTLGQHRPGTKPPWDKDASKPVTKEHHSGDSKPPQGFKLAGRIVTSPSDGLSYFLDDVGVDSNEDGGDWMMSIPYAYLECGPTIESTTEAFSLSDMVLRHFPASATMGHWTNLGGGVTIENGTGEGGDDDSDDTVRYIEGNHEGHPKLLVALSPIEITVSGNNEETRVFNAGEVILMEDTLGKGHKMKAAPAPADNAGHVHHGRDLSVLMVTLPHTVHFPMYDWLEESSYFSESAEREESRKSAMDHTSSAAAVAATSASPPTSFGAEHALYGFAPKHLHNKNRGLRKQSSYTKKGHLPCPLEYDSAYSSLFMPTHNQYHRHRRSRRNSRWKEVNQLKNSAFDDKSYPPPPGFSSYDKHSVLLDLLPSLRRTMLFGLGLSLTSSFIFCVQLLYPPLLVLFGGGTMILGGSLLSVLVTRWGYRNWVANWEEEWRWKREVKRNKLQREEAVKMQQEMKLDIQEDTDDGDTLQSDDAEDINIDKNSEESEPTDIES